MEMVFEPLVTIESCIVVLADIEFSGSADDYLNIGTFQTQSLNTCGRVAVVREFVFLHCSMSLIFIRRNTIAFKCCLVML